MKPSIYEVPLAKRGKLYIMPKPSGEWLIEDIAHYKMLGIDCIISLLRKDEIEELGLTHEAEACASASITFKRLAIQDRGLPNILPLRQLATYSADQINSGRSVAVHCRAGIGRAGLLVCCIMQELGIDAIQALQTVSDAARRYGSRHTRAKGFHHRLL